MKTRIRVLDENGLHLFTLNGVEQMETVLVMRDDKMAPSTRVYMRTSENTFTEVEREELHFFSMAEALP
jgi:hypothetical protein